MRTLAHIPSNRAAAAVTPNAQPSKNPTSDQRRELFPLLLLLLPSHTIHRVFFWPNGNVGHEWRRQHASTQNSNNCQTPMKRDMKPKGNTHQEPTVCVLEPCSMHINFLVTWTCFILPSNAIWTFQRMASSAVWFSFRAYLLGEAFGLSQIITCTKWYRRIAANKNCLLWTATAKNSIVWIVHEMHSCSWRIVFMPFLCISKFSFHITKKKNKWNKWKRNHAI